MSGVDASDDVGPLKSRCPSFCFLFLPKMLVKTLWISCWEGLEDNDDTNFCCPPFFVHSPYSGVATPLSLGDGVVQEEEATSAMEATGCLVVALPLPCPVVVVVSS